MVMKFYYSLLWLNLTLGLTMLLIILLTYYIHSLKLDKAIGSGYMQSYVHKQWLNI